MLEQKELIRDFIQNDQWLLIILDACRYDVLNDLVDCEPCRSPALYTSDWIRKTWPYNYDAVYISATPWIMHNYNGFNHFNDVYNVWDYGWDKQYKTVLPGTMFKSVMNLQPKRAVVHIMQPHLPYVGEIKLESRGLGQGPRVGTVAGKYGDGKLKEGYIANLKYALKEAIEPLKENFKGKIKVTADHGELLGERIDGEKKYGHNKPDCKILRTVPWW